MVPVMEEGGEQLKTWRLGFCLSAFVVCSTEKLRKLNIDRLLIVPNHAAAQLTIQCHVVMLWQEPIVAVYDTRFRGKDPKRVNFCSLQYRNLKWKELNLGRLPKRTWVSFSE